MTVPPDVRAAALAAFTSRRTSALLALVSDSFTDEPGPPSSERRLVYRSDEPAVRLDVAVTYRASLADLVVHVAPPGPADVTVEVLSPVPRLHLAVSGTPPLRLSVAASGPFALSVRRAEDEQAWQTSWMSL